MKALENMMGVFTVVLILFNALGGIVAGIWLAILGEWGFIGYGLMFSIGGVLLISFAMLPGLLLAGPALLFEKKGIKIGSYFFGFLSIVYTFAVLTAWCLFILYSFVGHIHDGSVIPWLLWSYSVATGPIAYLAQKDLQSGNEYAGLAPFFTQIAFVLIIISILFFNPTDLMVVVIFSSVVAIGMIFHAMIAFTQSNAGNFRGRT